MSLPSSLGSLRTAIEQVIALRVQPLQPQPIIHCDGGLHGGWAVTCQHARFHMVTGDATLADAWVTRRQPQATPYSSLNASV